MHKAHESAEATGVVSDGVYEINVTPELRERFNSLMERNNTKFSDEGGGLCRKSQFEMYTECDYKESRVLELLHYLTRTQGLKAEDVCERIRMFSQLTRGLSVRIASDQARQRKQATEKVSTAAKEFAMVN